MRNPLSRRTTTALALTATLAPVVALSACGSDSGSKSSTTSAVSSSAPSSAASSSAASDSTAAATPVQVTPAKKGTLAGAIVGGTEAAPTLKLANNKLSVTETTVQVLKEGTGDTLKAGDITKDDVVLVTGGNGATVYDTHATKRPETWKVGDPQVLKGISKLLVGQKVGTRLVAAVPPADAFGQTGQPQLKVGKDDSLVMLVDIVSKAPTPLKEATGTAVAPKAGMPTVTFHSDKAADIAIPKTAAPTSLQVQNLIDGSGPVVKAGNQVTVTYTGVTWADGKKFDSSFDHGSDPTTFAVGTGGLIPAWDKGLVGKKVGDRVLIVAPPSEAYGAQAKGSIPANSTLAFVVDILATF